MTSLVRTRACGFSIADCVTLDQLEKAANSGGDLSGFVRPIESVFAEFPDLHIKGAQERMYRNGVKLDLDKLRFDRSAARIRVYGENGFIGTAIPDTEKGVLRVDKKFQE